MEGALTQLLPALLLTQAAKSLQLAIVRPSSSMRAIFFISSWWESTHHLLRLPQQQPIILWQQLTVQGLKSTTPLLWLLHKPVSTNLQEEPLLIRTCLWIHFTTALKSHSVRPLSSVYKPAIQSNYLSLLWPTSTVAPSLNYGGTSTTQCRLPWPKLTPTTSTLFPQPTHSTPTHWL